MNTTATHIQSWCVTVRTIKKQESWGIHPNLLESPKKPHLEDQTVSGSTALTWINTVKGGKFALPSLRRHSLLRDWVVISSTHFPHCYHNTNDKSVYPGMPPDSMWLASVTSYDHTSNCHLRRPSTPHRTEPEWIPMRISRSTCKMNIVTNIVLEWMLITEFKRSKVPKWIQAYFAALIQRAKWSWKKLRGVSESEITSTLMSRTCWLRCVRGTCVADGTHQTSTWSSSALKLLSRSGTNACTSFLA